MNVINDIFTFADDISKAKTAKTIEDETIKMAKNIVSRPKIRSLSSYAGNAIYYFPLLVSSSISPDTAMMAANSIESSYCSFVRAAFELLPAIKVDGKVLNVDKYLKIFHQNIGIDSDQTQLTENATYYKPWNEFNNDILDEAVSNSINKAYSKAINELKKGKTLYTAHVNTGVDAFANAKSEKTTQSNTTTTATNNDGDISTSQKTVTSLQNIPETEINRYTKYKMSDYQKANNLQPSIVPVTIKFLFGDSEKVIEENIIVGIKVQVHIIDSEQLVDRATDTIVGKGKLHDFIRWSTGEMLSLKDLLFGVSKIKNHVASEHNEANEWFNVFEQRKRLNSMSIPVLNKQTFLPNGSVALSIDDVKNAVTTYGIDLMNSTYAKKLLKNNFLLSFIITDDMTDTLYILYDGHDKFEYYTYSTINRENSSYNRDMKNLITAISKSR